MIDTAEISVLSNNYTPGPGGGALNNGHWFVNRREVRTSNATGALPVIKTPGIERSAVPAFDFEQMMGSLHELFEHDRQIASLPDATRCGICYLHFSVSELFYREEEGFYVCQSCGQALGRQILPMLRQQQKM